MQAQIFPPVIRVARWILTEAKDDDVRRRMIGMSYLEKVPHGHPKPSNFCEWRAKHIEFVMKFNKKFKSLNNQAHRYEWERCTDNDLPQSDDVYEYARRKSTGGEVHSPDDEVLVWT